MERINLFLISSGIPDGNNKYRSPYILRYIEFLKEDYNLIFISPKFLGFFGVIECNLKILYFYLTGQINSSSKIYIHSILHSFLFAFYKGPVFINFHGVEIYSFDNNLVRIPIQYFLWKKSDVSKGIFPSYFMLNSVLDKYKFQFNDVLINYSLGVDLTKIRKFHKKGLDFDIFYPGNLSSLKGIDDFEFCVKNNPDFNFFCLPSVYEKFNTLPNIYLQPEFEFEDRYMVLSKYSILLQLSNFESLSLIVIESYILGLFCIVKEIPVMNELKSLLPNLYFYSKDLNFYFFKINDKRNVITKNISLLSESECVYKTKKFIND